MISSPVSALVLIDAGIEQPHWFINSTTPDVKTIVLNPEQDGIEQITAAIAAHPQLSSLHIVSHGQAGELQLGSTRLSLQTLDRYAAQLRQWRRSLAGAEILLYGCRVAAGALGQRFIQTVSQLTQAAIAASSTLVGNAALGGNWQLDYQTRPIQTPIAFRSEALAAYPGVLAVLLRETFQNTDVGDRPWIFGTGVGDTTNPFLTARPEATPSLINGEQGLPGVGGTPLDPVGSGTLRLTDATPNESAFVIFNQAVDQSQGLTITFDLFSYGGTVLDGRTGDGISFFLIDGTATPTAPGAFGGSLGYAQKQVEGIAGIAGGYLGVGFDEFGNYSTSLEGTLLQRPTPAGVATAVPNSVAVRGSAASGYAFLGGTGSIAPDTNPTTRAAAQRRARIDLSPTGVLNVRVDLNNDNDFADTGEVVIRNFNVTQVNGALPSTFKLGFAASTGNATNIHEVRNLVAQTLIDPDTPIPPIIDPDNPDNPDNPDVGCLPGRTIRATPTNNRLNGTRNIDKLIGFAGNDVMQGKGCNDRLDAGRGNDRMFGNGGRDTLRGQTGDDRGVGGRGRDRMFGGLGNDVLDGENDQDRIFGGRGRDTLKGSKGADFLDGGVAEDRLVGGIGNDRLQGRQDQDILNGGSGDDVLSGGLVGDRLSGGRKQDTLDGGRGGDSLFGDGGNDTLSGGQGVDRLDGGNQADRLLGGTQDDILVGGGGRDRLSGDGGADRFVYRSARDRGDRILDFELGRGRTPVDLLDFRRIFSRTGYGSSNVFQRYIRLEQSRRNTLVRVDFNGDTAGGFRNLTTLNGIQAGSLSAVNFLL
ncbi:DUF4347 domain-containing protein [Phormidium tenue FACHB-886]|nr:DUF4347 domain-containing protein [Phormidium tenue FACHB-886]